MRDSYRVLARVLCPVVAILSTVVSVSAAPAGSGTSLRVIIRLNSSPDATPDSASGLSKPASYIKKEYPSAISAKVKSLDIPDVVVTQIAKEDLQLVINDPNVAEVFEDTLSKPSADIGASLPEYEKPVPPYSESKDGTVIAIIDTGIDTKHPYLKNKIIAEACFSSSSSEGIKSHSLCPNGKDKQITSGAAIDCDLHISGCGHGTNVAGIAAGGPATSDGKILQGVAPRAQLIAIQVYSRFDSADVCGNKLPCALSYASDQLSALNYLYESRNKFKLSAINMSLGQGKFSQPCDKDLLFNTVKKLREAGIATVVSSGNEGLTGFSPSPACIPGVISVGAVDASKNIAKYSNTSDMVTILAPGEDIISSQEEGKYGKQSGTSMATPQVSGALSLIRAQSPNAKLQDLIDNLVAGGTRVENLRTKKLLVSLDIQKTMSLLAIAKASKQPINISAEQPLKWDGVSPTRVVVVPAEDNNHDNSHKATAYLESSTGKATAVINKEGFYVIEMKEGINENDKAAIQAVFGEKSKISHETLSAPQER
ncbi:S8 family peptidase [Pseudomonas abietaniphila]|uniref:Serine protease, subtilisin family n=1 Tax=Pseudomonas abietaniphila TaxID=89065 RepID=A0A1G8SV86_9PSED|nr:S8 family serine peptidase [Pseudomonas abietaniphila]SDJ33159.1 Serine protease, subtilisin family [Pseudomonas abietaniphila]